MINVWIKLTRLLKVCFPRIILLYPCMWFVDSYKSETASELCPVLLALGTVTWAPESPQFNKVEVSKLVMCCRSLDMLTFCKSEVVSAQLKWMGLCRWWCVGGFSITILSYHTWFGHLSFYIFSWALLSFFSPPNFCFFYSFRITSLLKVCQVPSPLWLSILYNTFP